MKNKVKRTMELQRKYHEMREKMAEKVVPSKKLKSKIRSYRKKRRYLRSIEEYDPIVIDGDKFFI